MNPDRTDGLERRIEHVSGEVHDVATKLEVLTALIEERADQATTAIARRDRHLKQVASVAAIAQVVFYFAVLAAHGHVALP